MGRLSKVWWLAKLDFPNQGSMNIHQMARLRLPHLTRKPRSAFCTIIIRPVGISTSCLIDGWSMINHAFPMIMNHQIMIPAADDWPWFIVDRYWWWFTSQAPTRGPTLGKNSRFDQLGTFTRAPSSSTFPSSWHSDVGDCWKVLAANMFVMFDTYGYGSILTGMITTHNRENTW